MSKGRKASKKVENHWCNTTQFFKKWCYFTCLCAWASEGIFSGGATSGFFKKFFYGRPKVV